MKKGWKKHIVLIAVAAVVVLGILAYWIYTLISVQAITLVANQLKLDSSWKLEDSVVRPPQILCIDTACPSISKGWSTQRDIDGHALEEIVHSSGFTFHTSGDCDAVTTAEYKLTNSILCEATGTKGAYKVNLYTLRNPQHHPFTTTLKLYIEPKDD